MGDTAVHSGSEDPNRRDFIHIAALAAAGGAGAMLAWPLVQQMNPSGDTLALASIEVDLTKVTEGQMVTVKWRGKPLFVRYRTAAEIAEASRADGESMRDPQPDAERHLPGKPQYLVLIGVCTHLGCVPQKVEGDGKGWFGPCHGSEYDISGRIRKGPAPKNLEVPDLAMQGETTVKVG